MIKSAVTVAFVLLWSCGFVGAAWGTTAAEPAGLLAWRYVITAGLLLAVASIFRARVSRRELGQQCVLGLAAHVMFLGCLFAAAASGVGAGTAALVCSAQPLLVAAAGAAFWGDRLTPRQWAGVALGLGAVALCVGGVSDLGPAIALPVFSLLGLTCSALLERRWTPQVSVVTALTIQVSAAALVFVAAAMVTTGLAVEPTAKLAGSLAWLVFPAGLGGYGAYLLALRQLGATHTSMLLFLTPPVSAIWAWAMLGDRIGAPQLIAMGLGIVAVLLTARPGGRRREAAPHRASCAGPECAGPACAGPECADPACADPVREVPAAASPGPVS
ncbi:DMT family transporter [Rhodococcus sp. IEGM 1408]|uniref:DMT family transporter n=1 Tax=Rhodococcus sp. IEGM 1408 TaxID=3082220 RepID=UPI0029538AC6|nr:DMT family transporter [Rhodococcus sp. IEGM 1408]MDV7999942.1 DMT family transporter [Rhodococcus sp. IEGM 1408]